jgi:hypothetical protein
VNAARIVSNAVHDAHVFQAKAFQAEVEARTGHVHTCIRHDFAKEHVLQVVDGPGIIRL